MLKLNRKVVPSLSRLSTTKLALGRPVCTSIVARTTRTLCINHPVSPYALSIDPYLTLSHAAQVQGQWFNSLRCIEICLKISTIISFSVLSRRCCYYYHKPVTILLTLCHFNCDWLRTASESFSQSTDETPLGATKFIASPLRPIWVTRIQIPQLENIFSLCLL